MKNENRVNKCYEKDSKDWEEDYDMLHDDGVTCNDCFHINRCESMFGVTPQDESCGWYPNRFFGIEMSKGESDG